MSSVGEIQEVKEGRNMQEKGDGVFDAVSPVRIFFLATLYSSDPLSFSVNVSFTHVLFPSPSKLEKTHSLSHLNFILSPFPHTHLS